MANVNYSLNNVNKGLRGGIKYLDDFNVDNFKLSEFQEKMENVTKEAVKTIVDGEIQEVIDYDDFTDPGCYYIRNIENSNDTSGSANSPFNKTRRCLLIVRQIGDFYIHQTVYCYFNGNIERYDRRALKVDDEWEFWVNSTDQTPVPWIVTYSSIEPITQLERGGTGRKISNSMLTSQNNPFKNRIPRLSDPSNGEDAEMKFIQPKSGALYATETNGAPQFGTLPIAQGGTGRTTSPSIRVNLASEDTVNILSDTNNLKPGVEGVLPAKHGGAGRNLVEVGNNYIIRKSNPNDGSDKHPGLVGISPSIGALYYTGEKYEDGDTSLKQPPKFGILPLNCGGTGRTTSPSIIVDLTSKNAVNILSNTDDLKPGVEGILPVSQGGTGETSKPSINIIDSKYYKENYTNANSGAFQITNSNFRVKYIPYLALSFIRGSFAIKITNKHSGISSGTAYKFIEFDMNELLETDKKKWKDDVPELFSKGVGSLTIAINSYCENINTNSSFQFPRVGYDKINEDSTTTFINPLPGGISIKFNSTISAPSANESEKEYTIYFSGVLSQSL